MVVMKKVKLTAAKLKQYEEEMRRENKEFKRKNQHFLCHRSLEDYIQNIYGIRVGKKEFKELRTTGIKTPRDVKTYPSLKGVGKVVQRKHTKKYTGDYITGIATSHKSNLIPVSRGDDPKSYAQMRRN